MSSCPLMAPTCLAVISVCGINRIPSCSKVLPPMATNPNDWSDTFRAFSAAPSSLLELTVKQSVGAIFNKKQSVGAIFNKKQWWLKWQERVICMRWLDELQHEFLHQSFAQTLQWTRRSSTLRQLETSSPVSRWSVETLEPALTAAKKKTDARVIPRVVEFVRTVLEKGTTREAVEETLASVAARPYTFELLYNACNDIQKELIEVQEVITRTIDQLASSDDLRAQFANAENGVDTAVLSPTGIHGSWITDDFIPVAVKSTFLNQVAMLENVPDNLKDWHPDTNKQVLNLIH
uniref:DUF4246 domain-containing protein n=1 Tax=Globisporangium ultimum (strain ATCC 200006 / CBS 805.95 / DAOM BR144) TaxID=431595 RepID=K3X3F9_GLOUD